MNSAPVFGYLRRSKFQLFDIAIFLTAFLGAAHLLIRTSDYGPELTQDSWNYISVAENLAAGDGFKDWLQRAYTFGPIFSLLVALFGVLGFDPIDIGRLINVIGFGLIILLTGYQLSHHVRYRFLAVMGSVAVMTSFIMNDISSYLMSDTCYILFSLLALVQMWTFLTVEDRRGASLVLSAVFASLATATRYIGIAIILTGIIIILTRRNFTLYHRLKWVVIYGSISITLFGIWITKNQLFIGTITGYDDRRYYGSSLLEYIEYYSNIFVSRILALHLGLDWLLYLSFVFLCLVIWRKKLRRNAGQAHYLESQNSQYITPLILFGSFSLIYVAMLLAMSPRLDYADALPYRYLAPIYVPVIIMALILLDMLLKDLAKGPARKINAVLSLIIICIISTGILTSIDLSTRWNIDMTARALGPNARPILFEDYGYSYDMDLLVYLRDNPPDGPVYSNGLHLLYWLTDIPLGGIVAEDRGNASCLTWVRSLTRSTDPSYIAYFIIGRERIDFIDGQFNACNIQELESNPNIQNYLERMVEKFEGIVYRVTSPPGPRPDYEVTIDAKVLTYIKEPCDPADIEPYFFLHVTPVDKNALSSHRSLSTFDNLDFHFEDHGIMLNGECRITVELPHYDISHIRTGQYTSEKGELWSAQLSVR